MRLPDTLVDRLLVAYATGRLPSFVARRVRAQLNADPELAAMYDALCRAERVAASAALTHGQRERLALAVLDGSEALRGTHVSITKRLMAHAAPVTLAAAAAGLFLFVGTGDGLTARSASGAGNAAHERAPLGVKATCLSADGVRLIDSATVGAARTADRLTCPAGSLIAFSTTNMGDQARHVFVVGVTAAGERRWYQPFGEAASVAVPAGTVDQVLSPVADTRGMGTEPVSLHVLITDTPLSAREVENELSAAIDRGMSVGRAERLPIDVALQARIELTP